MSDTLRRKTPIMGWASWNCFRTNISESKLKEQMDALLSTGLAECGYCFMNMDDGFFGGRDETGKLRFHKERFPNGIKPVADYAHSLGLKAGTYSEGGSTTCGYYFDAEGENGRTAGLYGHEREDLAYFFLTCGFDFLKVDWCGGLREGADEEQQYTKIGHIMEELRQKTQKPLVYNICCKFFPGEWALPFTDSWRTAADIAPDFHSILKQIDHIKPLRKYCAPGHVNDLDMMQIGNGISLTDEQTHFSMWCMMSTPLMIGCDLTKISPNTLRILKNRELIALDQDPACLQAYVVKEYRDSKGTLLGEIWVKDLGKKGSEEKAIAFLNRSEEPLFMQADKQTLGLEGNLVALRDLWAHEDLPLADIPSFTVAAHDTVVLRAKSEKAGETTDLNAAEEYREPQKKAPLTASEAHALIQKGALLLDVRSQEEYQKSHPAKAKNLPFTEVYRHASEVIPHKSTPCLLYCSEGLRSEQARYMLEHMGYTAVYLLDKNHTAFDL